MQEASIDLGTNTCLLLVQNGDSILHDESNVVRLGQNVDQTGELNADAMKRARDCIAQYVQIAAKHGVKAADIVAVGTAQARDAKNANSFFDSIQKELGVKFKTISGEQEARATFLGAALPNMDAKKMVVMDIGGGSTELVSGAGGKSIDIGAVRMTERFLKSDPVTDEQFWKCREAIDNELKKMIPWRESLKIEDPTLVAVAGTAVTMAMMMMESAAKYDRNLIDGMTISRGDAHRLVEELKWRSVKERSIMPGMEPKRADVMLAGTLIFWRALETLDFKKAVVSTRGLRYGVLKIRPELQG